MTEPITPKTALVLIDVYNDFLHPKGKLTAALAESLQDTDTINHLKQALAGARSAKVPVYYSLHQQTHDHKFDGFEHWNDMLKSLKENRAFEEGSFGAEVFPDLAPKEGEVTISKHWNQSSFKNNDLDWLLRQRNITNVVFAGLVANSCIETSGREANELGYHVTMLSDATACWTTESKNATVKYSWPAFAHSIKNTEEWLSEL